MNDLLSIGLWNVEWHSALTEGISSLRVLQNFRAMFFVSQKGNADLLPKLGHIITSDAIPSRENAAKFLLWSRAPWRKSTLSARRWRFVAGPTSTRKPQVLGLFRGHLSRTPCVMLSPR